MPYFNPRSLTGATDRLYGNLRQIVISIHAPSRERPLMSGANATARNFNPRSLTGATILAVVLIPAKAFQSTLPHGSDSTDRTYCGCWNISIHAPSRERLLNGNGITKYSNFNPRSLTGATPLSYRIKLPSAFQSTLPHGSDCELLDETVTDNHISIHAPSRERRKR